MNTDKTNNQKGNMSELYMVFDVESVGLHGEGFAVGFVVVDMGGHEHAAATIHCEPCVASGDAEGHNWVSENVPKSMPGILKPHPKLVRDSFWKQWRYWQEQGAVLAADCPWPVEARFLNQCLFDAGSGRDTQGPYPLIDVASVLLAKGINPLGTFDRLPNELPKHNPECDARQSARLLIGALRTGIE